MRRRLRNWSKTNARDFPWRHRPDPYAILVAEMMLRRTRAAQVAPVFERFIAAFPTPSALEMASESELGATLRPLGLNWRIRQFHLLAEDICARFAGQVPCDRTALMTLPGVSDYVADAVLSFACGQRRAVLDNPIARVLGRCFGLPTGPEARRNRLVRSAAQDFVGSNAALHNFALIDLAALVCRPTSPKHDCCPLAKVCLEAKRKT
jgi:A/G-specific adenine glycosylase